VKVRLLSAIFRHRHLRQLDANVHRNQRNAAVEDTLFAMPTSSEVGRIVLFYGLDGALNLCIINRHVLFISTILRPQLLPGIDQRIRKGCLIPSTPDSLRNRSATETAEGGFRFHISSYKQPDLARRIVSLRSAAQWRGLDHKLSFANR